MIRCTIEVVPFGIEERKKKIGMIEIGNDGSGGHETGNYNVILKKTAPFKGALVATWRKVVLDQLDGDEDIVAGKIKGFHRTRRGVYDLLYRALKSCGLDKRNR